MAHPRDIRIKNTRLDPEQYFTKLECISKGSFGEVYKGINNCRKKVVAIKIIDWEEAEDEMEDIQQEITVLSQCDSPFLTRYFGSYLKGTKLWITMDYLGRGSALDMLKTGPLEEAYIATFLREILKGLDYLHSERKIHRDIKAANLLLSEHGDAVGDAVLDGPGAKELLRHKFITRYTKKMSYLSELIDLHRRWKSEGHGDESRSDDSDMDGEGGDQCPVWTFSLHCKVLFYEQMTARPQPHRQDRGDEETAEVTITNDAPRAHLRREPERSPLAPAR